MEWRWSRRPVPHIRMAAHFAARCAIGGLLPSPPLGASACGTHPEHEQVCRLRSQTRISVFLLDGIVFGRSRSGVLEQVSGNSYIWRTAGARCARQSKRMALTFVTPQPRFPLPSLPRRPTLKRRKALFSGTELFLSAHGVVFFYRLQAIGHGLSLSAL